MQPLYKYGIEETYFICIRTYEDFSNFSLQRVEREREREIIIICTNIVFICVPSEHKIYYWILMAEWYKLRFICTDKQH